MNPQMPWEKNPGLIFYQILKRKGRRSKVFKTMLTRQNSWAKQVRKLEWGHWTSWHFDLWGDKQRRKRRKIFREVYIFCTFCIFKDSQVQHITLFLYSEFHEDNLNHQEAKSEWIQNGKTKIQTTDSSWNFHFSTFERRDMAIWRQWFPTSCLEFREAIHGFLRM